MTGKKTPREPVVRVKYLDWAYRQPLRLTRKGVLIYLVRRANKDARCWPEQRTIAREIGVGVRSVVDSIRVLKLCGLVNVIRQEKRRRGQAGVKNTYQLNYAVETTPEVVRQAEIIAKNYTDLNAQGAHCLCSLHPDQSASGAVKTTPVKVQNLQDQSARGGTEERHEEGLLVYLGVSSEGLRTAMAKKSGGG